MAERNIKGKIQMRYDTAANWESKNPVLAVGEWGYDSTNNIVKIGDGTTAWNNLPYLVNANDIPSVSLQKDSWKTIARISASGDADLNYAVGDKKTIRLSTGETVTLIVLGFNHDNLTGGGKAGITFGMENCLTATYPMNPTDTTVGGWDKSIMRTTTMATLFNQLPSDLQPLIKQVNKLASAGNGSATITTSADKLFLFSKTEIDNDTAAVYASEGVQYEYWKMVGSTVTPAVNPVRVKYLANGGGVATRWWLRSPYYGESIYFCPCSATGSINYALASLSSGVCFGFCI